MANSYGADSRSDSGLTGDSGQGAGYGVLFLCTGNSARSILAEAALARRGSDRFRSYSAGSQPKSAPHPRTLEVLERRGYRTAGLTSKSWEVFSGPAAPRVDFVITVCGNAAGEVCPLWPGDPVTVHWGVEDPAAFTGSAAEERARFEAIHDQLASKIDGLVALDLDRLDASERLSQLRELAARG